MDLFPHQLNSTVLSQVVVPHRLYPTDYVKPALSFWRGVSAVSGFVMKDIKSVTQSSLLHQQTETKYL